MIYVLSGGAGLNFKVVGGTTQPTNPTENTIWVNTDTTITSYKLSPTTPTNPTDGMAWIDTAASGIVAFNALKKNGIQVYPTACNQYINGAWWAKDSAVYQHGEWKELVVNVFDDGKIFFGEFVVSKAERCSIADGKIKLSYSGTDGSWAYFTETVNVTNLNKLRIESTVSAYYESGGYAFHPVVSLTNTTPVSSGVPSIMNRSAAYVRLGKTSTPTIYEVDISQLSGDYYIEIGAIATGEIYRIWFE